MTITAVTYDNELTIEVGKRYDHDEYLGGTVNALYAKGSGLYKGMIEAELLFEDPKTDEQTFVYVDAETLRDD
jgi:hypothetical protein